MTRSPMGLELDEHPIGSSPRGGDPGHEACGLVSEGTWHQHEASEPAGAPVRSRRDE
jgi:hypothetical protein